MLLIKLKLFENTIVMGSRSFWKGVEVGGVSLGTMRFYFFKSVDLKINFSLTNSLFKSV